MGRWLRRRRRPAVPAVSGVWLEDGVFVSVLSNWQGTLRQRARAAGYGWVAVQLANAPWQDENLDELMRLRAELDLAGWKVVGWATYGQGTDPVADGAKAAGLVSLLRLDGWVANGEDWAEGVNAWKTKAFLRAGGGGKPLAFSVLSSTTASYGREFDYPAALSYPGSAIMPQVYGATVPAYTVEAMRASLNITNVPLERVCPTFEVRSSDSQGPFWDYQRWKGPRSLWLGDYTLNDVDCYRKLKEASEWPGS